MGIIFKIFGIFLILWLIWYLSGGPQRSTNIKPYVKFNSNNTTISPVADDLQEGLGGQVVNPTKNLQNLNDTFQTFGE